MAKISELPSAATLDGTEIIPIVQGGTTKGVSAASLSGAQIGFRVENSIDQSINMNTIQKVEFNNVIFDYGSGWDAVNNRYQPTEPGLYQVSVSCMLGQDNGNGGFLIIYKNGVWYSESTDTMVMQTNYNVIPSLSTLVEMNGTTDYLEIFLWADSGNGTIKGRERSTNFSAHRVGGGAVASKDSFSGVINDTINIVDQQVMANYNVHASYTHGLMKTSSNFNTSTGIYTIPQDGDYEFAFTANFEYQSRVGDFSIQVTRSGLGTSVVTPYMVHNGGSVTWANAVSATTIVTLSASDTVFVRASSVTGTINTFTRIGFSGKQL